MHTNRVKAKVDFKFCMGNIPAMLRATKPVLSERQYKELCNEVVLSISLDTFYSNKNYATRKI